jgi:septum formation protein
VTTAVVLALPDGKRLSRTVETIVTFQRLTEQQVAAYLAGSEWRGKAGGYAIQGQAEAFVRFLSGSHSNVVGLPLFETAQLLRGIGWLRP